MTKATDVVAGDAYQWLEDVDADHAMAWVRERNAHAVAALTGGERFEALRAELLAVLDSDRRIPVVTWREEHVYNFWQDAQHPRGLWRRTTPAEYRRSQPAWQVLLDLDALAAQEGESWVWGGATVLRPSCERCLITLSRGGSDAAVVREFHLGELAFVDGGFALPEAKSDVSWIDENRIYVMTDFGPGSLTSSGYPRIVKEWRRGTPLASATVVFEGDVGDVGVSATRDQVPGFERDFVIRNVDFYHSEKFLRTDAGDLVRIDLPPDALLTPHREWLLVRLRSPWTVNGATYAAGSLLVAPFDGFLAGERKLTVLFEPTARTYLDHYALTRNHVIVGQLSDVRSQLDLFTCVDGVWRREPSFAGQPDDAMEFGYIDIMATNPDHSDEYLMLTTGFIKPSTLYYGAIGGGRAEPVKQAPTFFDAAGLSVDQFFATSVDGTRVPYFVVGRHGGQPGLTLLTGYGGFLHSLTPEYNGLRGRGWLARGGTFVVANIRGGAEYGPQWHQAALRENRPRAYEDFAAVAVDLVSRGITTPRQLGIEGGSNGGLLMGVMLTQHPQLFGAMVARAPLMDMRRYHKLLAGASWMAEYGDPDDEADWAYLKRFSPYHNVHRGVSYPPVLLIASTRDDRVHPGHARKMVALLREYGQDVTYYENIEGGHPAAADHDQLAFVWALAYEFLWRHLS